MQWKSFHPINNALRCISNLALTMNIWVCASSSSYFRKVLNLNHLSSYQECKCKPNHINFVFETIKFQMASEIDTQSHYSQIYIWYILIESLLIESVQCSCFHFFFSIRCLVEFYFRHLVLFPTSVGQSYRLWIQSKRFTIWNAALLHIIYSVWKMSWTRHMI